MALCDGGASEGWHAAVETQRGLIDKPRTLRSGEMKWIKLITL